MRKLIAGLLLSFTAFTSTYAQAVLGSPLTVSTLLIDSVFEIEAIIVSPLLQEVIPSTEFIVELKRLTKDLDADTIFWEIETVVTKGNGFAGEVDQVIEITKRRPPENRYLVTEVATTDPMTGTRVVSVTSIEKISHKHKTVIFE